MFKNKGKFILIIIFILALVVRLGILSVTHHETYYSSLTARNGELAHYLIRGKGFVTNPLSNITGQQNKLKKLIDFEDYAMPLVDDKFLEPCYIELPGYAVLLAFTYKIFGQERYIYLQVIQAILSALGVFLIFSLAKKLFSKKVGFISAFLWAFWISEARLSVMPLRDAFMAVSALLACYFFVRGATEKRSRFFIFSGITLGFASCLCSHLLFLSIFFGLALLLFWKDLKQALFKTFLMLAITLLILLPWGLRNYSLTGRFIITRYAQWQAFWEGFGEFKNPFGAVRSDETTTEQVLKEYPDISGTVEFQDVLKQKVIGAIKSEPLWYIKMLPKRLLNMLFLQNYNDWGLKINPKLSFFESDLSIFQYILKYPKELLYRILPRLFELILFIFALCGLWIYRKDWRKIMLIFCIPIYGILLHLPIYWEPRYILPTSFPYLILTAVVLLKLFRIFKAKLIHKDATK